MNYLIYSKNTGEILRQVSCPESMAHIQAQEGEDILPFVAEVIGSHYYDIGTKEFKPIPNQPTKYHKFNWAIKVWEDPRTLEDYKTQAWENMKLLREADKLKPLITSYGTFDADVKSQKNITDSIMMLQTMNSIGTPITVNFTLADNTTVELDLQKMVEVGMTLGKRTQELQDKGTELRAKIDSASTREEVDSIRW